MEDESQLAELPLAADADTLAQLAELLPLHYVRMRHGGGIIYPAFRMMAVRALADALAKGVLIDRSNADGELTAWDGWLVVHTSPLPTFIETAWKLGQ